MNSEDRILIDNFTEKFKNATIAIDKLTTLVKAELIPELNRISEAVRDLEQETHELRVLLLGKLEDPNDKGLVGMIEDNTRFRKVTGTWLKTIATSIVAIFTKLFYDGFK